MSAPENNQKFVPKQALQPTPQLYDLLVSDGMENLATASLNQIPAIPSGSVLHDNGCGTGAATRVVMQAIAKSNAAVTIKATDIDDKALEIYRTNAVNGVWPAEASQQDSGRLDFADNTFTHSILNAVVFLVPGDGIGAVSEVYRTLKPGGVMVVNCWHYVPNAKPLQVAAKLTRPTGSPGSVSGLGKWEAPELLRDVVEQGGFAKGNIRLVQVPVECTTAELTQYATMLWSFIGGRSAPGWLESDEENWDRAIEILKDELRKTDGFEEMEGGKAKLKFVANVVVATK